MGLGSHYFLVIILEAFIEAGEELHVKFGQVLLVAELKSIAKLVNDIEEDLEGVDILAVAEDEVGEEPEVRSASRSYLWRWTTRLMEDLMRLALASFFSRRRSKLSESGYLKLRISFTKIGLWK